MPVVVHLSDVHFGAHDDLLVESLLVDVAGRRPDLVVVSGDWTQRARRAQFASARALLDRLPAPVLSVVGNHDLPLFDVARRVLAPTLRYRKSIASSLDPVLAVPGLVVVGLDTMPAWRWKSGHVSARQARVVRDAFGQSAPGDWRLLVTHHPVLPRDLSGLIGRRMLVEASARSGVMVLLSGHTHTASVDLVTLEAPGRRHRALSVGAGTATSTRTRGTANAYAVLRFERTMRAGARMAVEVRRPTSHGWSTTRTVWFEVMSDGRGLTEVVV